MTPVPDRRRLLQAVAALGIGTGSFHRAAVARVTQEAKAGTLTITPEMMKEAEWVAGITLNDLERETLAASLNRIVDHFHRLQAIPTPNDLPPAVGFDPAPGLKPWVGDRGDAATHLPKYDVSKPKTAEEQAFLSVAKLANLVKSKQVTSVELTRLYLDRLKKYNPALLCVVSFTEELAMRQAEATDKEIAAGRYRGPLHGIPWGAKDLISYPGYKTTWGAEHFRNQQLDTKAEIARRLENAGAVLTAKLTLGALAQGDEWFGGKTRNPWNVKEGSSGSSAGSASAVAAGCVGFAIGSETLGSIVSPSTRCGVTGLRPTFGRISRAGCMALTWSMDKLGPMARSAEDCALIFAAVHGRDPADPGSVDRPFHWPHVQKPSQLKVGVYEDDGQSLSKDDRQILRDIGVSLVPINKLIDAMYTRYPVLNKLTTILHVEAATLFDELTRQGVREGIGDWSNTFRRGRFISAVEYLRANRIRTLLMREFAKVMQGVDVLAPFPDSLTLTNLTGHPQICLPNGFTNRGGATVPTSIVFTGGLFAETELLHVAHEYQQATNHHLKHPTYP